MSVVVSVGDRDLAQDLVAEAFARAWASWRTVGRHPAPAAWGRREKSTIFAALPENSPTVGLIWPSAIFTPLV